VRESIEGEKRRGGYRGKEVQEDVFRGEKTAKASALGNRRWGRKKWVEEGLEVNLTRVRVKERSGEHRAAQPPDLSYLSLKSRPERSGAARRLRRGEKGGPNEKGGGVARPSPKKGKGKKCTFFQKGVFQQKARSGLLRTRKKIECGVTIPAGVVLMGGRR